ncbi:MAG: O-antigen ligase family protein [Xanthobacteraceae bacterium]
MPLRRSAPPSSILIALGALLLGAATGAGIVLVRLPPDDDEAQQGGAWRQRIGNAAKGAAVGFWTGAGSAKIPVLAVLPAVDVSFGLSTVDDPRSPFAKGIHKIYDALRESPPRPDNPSVLVVALDAEDDSATVALTLAALAAENERVLLIDADIERWTLAAIDAEQSEAGVVDVAMGRRLLSDVTTCDRETNINLVSFVSPESRPENVRHFSDLMAAVALITLAACYLGVLLMPQLAVHQATDFLEPEHAGNWRGVFAHKNQAGAVMVMIVFIGLFVARMRSLALGGLITVLALIFLGFSQSKTAIGVMPLVFILAGIINRSRRPMVGIALVVVILAAFNLFSVGTVIFEPVRKLVEMVMPDATFTGRTEIWELGVRAVAERPITGYGFSSFFGTDEVVYGLGENASWANAATDAHNAYLNLALTIGQPGLLLTILWVVVLPIADFYRLPADSEAAPLQLLFLRVCRYGIYSSCFESSTFQQVGEVWFFFVVSAFGLRYASLVKAKT